VKPVLIFDLDGTLVDSKKDLTASVNHVRAKFELTALSEEQIAGLIGGGAQDLIRKALGPDVPESELQPSLRLFLTYYRAHMLDRTVLYPGVRETLDRLQDFRLAVLTNKPVHFSCSMLDGLGIYRYFSAVYGGNSFENKKPNPVGIFQILSDTRGHREKTWMIGDSSVDVLTGRNAGVITCGVTYGYAPETFQANPPDYEIDRFSELEGLVRNGSTSVPPSEK
jgi:phosphoglycolate phosphatase